MSETDTPNPARQMAQKSLAAFEKIKDDNIKSSQTKIESAAASGESSVVIYVPSIVFDAVTAHFSQDGYIITTAKDAPAFKRFLISIVDLLDDSNRDKTPFRARWIPKEAK